MSGLVVVVSSFPRSGTHFLIDMLRLNYTEFSWKPPIWASAEELYFNLDRFVLNAPAWSKASLKRDNIIVKTHRLPFAPELQEHLAQLAGDRRIAFVTPVRRLEKQLASYHRYTAADTPADQFLEGPDPFYGGGMSVKQAVKTFYSFRNDESVFIDVEHGLSDPAKLLDHLGNKLTLNRSTSEAVLPQRRTSHGLTGEIAARLTRRQSSEVVVRKAHSDEQAERLTLVDTELLQLEQYLRQVSGF